MEPTTMKLAGETVHLLTEEDARHSAVLEGLMARLAAEDGLSDEELAALVHVTTNFEANTEYSNAVKATVEHLKVALYGEGAEAPGDCRTIWNAAETLKEMNR